MASFSNETISDGKRFFLKANSLQEPQKNDYECDMEYHTLKRAYSDKKMKYLQKSVEIYNRICMHTGINAQDKLRTLEEFTELIPLEGYDMLARLRDMIPHVRGGCHFNGIIDLLLGVIKSSRFSDHERLLTATCLYNNCIYDRCYQAFSDIAFDVNMGYVTRVEACRYLYASEAKINMSMSQEALIDILEDSTISSEKRYSIIASFIKRTGINTLTSSAKLQIIYNESFLYGLQSAFFFNNANADQQRILSGQHLLQMDIPSKEKDEIVDALFSIANDNERDEDVRADAADVVIRLGSGDQILRANELIRNLGFARVKKNTGKGTIMDKSETIYNNSQNVHEFSPQLTEIMEHLFEDTILGKSYADIYDELVGLVKKYTFPDNKKKFEAMKALNRINSDTAVFTKYKITLPELMVCIYTKIKSFNEEDRGNIEQRLVEELVDMADKCSTGNGGRLVNVLNGVVFELKITWEDQIIANMAGRMHKRIRECTDDVIRDHISVANTEFATEEDTIVYNKYIIGQLSELRDELRDEFVSTGYVSQEDFDLYFDKGKEKWFN